MDYLFRENWYTNHEQNNFFIFLNYYDILILKKIIFINKKQFKKNI